MDLIFLYEINKSMAEKEELTSQNYHTIFEITRKDLWLLDLVVWPFEFLRDKD